MSNEHQDDEEKKIINFHQMELDDRILKVINQTAANYCALNLLFLVCCNHSNKTNLFNLLGSR